MAQRAKIEVKGIVQGVGFRPYVYNLAESLSLCGYVTNTSDGVTIEVEGENIESFIKRLPLEAPPLSKIVSLEVTNLPYKNFKGFRIIESSDNGRFTLISPDVSICEDCLKELFDPKDRRYLYPFINCTNCGPRYSIITSIPYDRPNTTMSVFTMCDDCSKEYNDPKDRRFHAQPNACSLCGPKIELKTINPAYSNILTDNPIKSAIEILKRGGIIAIKGLGGFHIACDALNDDAVRVLRERKRKNNKPFALMAPHIESVLRFCHCSEEEMSLLLSKNRPIVLLKKKKDIPLSEAISPNNSYFGFMLPYTPLHYLLFYYPEGQTITYHFDALVMTSGNLSEEPIIKDNDEAIKRLGGVVDAFLLHNRDIFMRVDDSVVRVSCYNRRPQAKEEAKAISFIRRARGFVPEPIELNDDGPDVLGCGADLKNTFTITKGRFAIPGQHIGDMENYETLSFFEESLKNIKQIYRSEPVAIAHDLHPSYISTHWALRQGQKGLITLGVQHHFAHIASVMAENNIKEKVIGVALDGTGYGTDGHLWGGEFLVSDIKGFERPIHFAYISLPGGERAIREPWRMAVSYIIKSLNDREKAFYYLEKIGLTDIFGSKVREVIKLVDKSDFSPLSSGAGRLFDAVSAMLGLCHFNTFEGEAAIALESLVDDNIYDSYEFDLRDVIDFSPTIKSILKDLENSLERPIIATKFHNTVSFAIVEGALKLSQLYDIRDVVLSGGTFQNQYLLKKALENLIALGLNVYINEKVPCNDGGISLGQAYILRERIKEQ